MTVYVDRMHRRAHRLVFTAHMMSDVGTDELDAMALAIGMKRAWKQRPGEPMEHYDLTEPRRRRAVALGAVEVSSRDMLARCKRSDDGNH